jgi:hypothetical protein
MMIAANERTYCSPSAGRGANPVRGAVLSASEKIADCMDNRYLESGWLRGWSGFHRQQRPQPLFRRWSDSLPAVDGAEIVLGFGYEFG